jgi:hypothetical protein
MSGSAIVLTGVAEHMQMPHGPCMYACSLLTVHFLYHNFTPHQHSNSYTCDSIYCCGSYGLVAVHLMLSPGCPAVTAPAAAALQTKAAVSGILAHRRLLAPQACASSSRALLTNGYFSMGDNADPRNMLVAATMVSSSPSQERAGQ